MSYSKCFLFFGFFSELREEPSSKPPLQPQQVQNIPDVNVFVSKSCRLLSTLAGEHANFTVFSNKLIIVSSEIKKRRVLKLFCHLYWALISLCLS